MSGNGSGILKNKTRGVSTNGLRAEKLLRAREPNTNNAVLPPSQDAVLRAIEAQICPFCGSGPYKVLAGHTNRAHGVDRLELRDMAGVTYKTSICSEEVREERSTWAKENLVSARPRNATKPKKRRLSKAASMANRKKLDDFRASLSAEELLEQHRQAAKARHTPEKDAEHSIKMRQKFDEKLGEPEHGTRRMYRVRGCRCIKCRAGNTAEHRRYLESKRTENQ